MKFKLFISFLFLGIIQSCYLIGELRENELEYIRESQLYIGDLTLYLSKEDMIKYLGEPDSIKHDNYYYDGLKVLVPNNEKIWDVICTNPKYSTADGIRIGDSKQKVLNAYGTTKTFTNEDIKTMIYENYNIFDPFPLYLKFEIKNNIVQKIQLWFHYE